MGFEAVTDTGPVLHLHEINADHELNKKTACTSYEVKKELQKYHLDCLFSCLIADSEKTNYFYLKHTLDLGEASCLTLCIQHKIKIFFTDDLSARAAAKTEGLEPHGTISIILKAFTQKQATKKQTIEYLKSLRTSSLFITQRLLDQAINAVLVA